MPYPDSYARDYGFEGFQDTHPNTPLPGNQVDAEFDDVSRALKSTQDFIRKFTRSDGRLGNGSVGVDQLAADFKVGFKAPTEWEADVNYLVSDTVFRGDGFYVCVVAHTSGAVFDSANWDLILDFGIAARLAAASADAAATSATSASTSATSADESAISAGNSATTATTQAGNADDSATAAAASADISQAAAAAASLLGPTNVIMARNYATLALADAAAVAGQGIVNLDKDFTLSGDVTLHARWVAAGGTVDVGDHDVTFSGGFEASASHRVFDITGTGLVTIAGTSDVHVGWFLDLAADDDSLAMDAAEACAHASGATLHWSRAKTLKYNGNHTIRTSLKGNGALLQQASADVILGSASGLVTVGARDIELVNFTVDCQFKSAGIGNISKNNVTYRDVHAKNCIYNGFNAYLCDHVKAKGCSAVGVKYVQTGVAGQNADGFYFTRCTNSGADECHAEDVRRIGFVGEGDGGANNGKNMVFRNLTIKNLNNCDDSTTEYNAGVWVEDCDSATVENIRIDNAASGVGQTNGRTRGVIIAGGENSAGKFVVRNIDVRGGDDILTTAVVISTTRSDTTVDVQNVFIDNAHIGISTIGSAACINIADIHLNNMSYSAAAYGGVLFDVSAATLGSVNVSNVTETNNATTQNNTGTIAWYSANANTHYSLKGLRGPDGWVLTHVMHGEVFDILVDNSAVLAGSDNYRSFVAVRSLHIRDTYLRLRDGVASASAFRVLANGRLVFEDCDIAGPAAGWSMEFSEANVSHSWLRCAVSGVQFLISTTGTFSDSIEGGTWINAPATGAYLANYNNPTSHVFKSIGVTYRGANVPLQKKNYNPTAAILVGNASEATLYNFDGGVTESANVDL